MALHSAVTSHDLDNSAVAIDNLPLAESTAGQSLASLESFAPQADAPRLRAGQAFFASAWGPSGPVLGVLAVEPAAERAVDAALVLPSQDGPRVDVRRTLLAASPAAESPRPAARDQALADEYTRLQTSTETGQPPFRQRWAVLRELL